MDGNKDEALKCLRIGKEAVEAGDQARALKILNKARRLDPTLPVDDLLSSIGGGREWKQTPSPQATAKPEQSPGGPREKDSSNSPSESSRLSTEEQVTIVGKIKKQKDYYEILGLERSCTVEDVRKAYRKLSLKVHPDKNKAPGAEEAFKAVSKAFQCLSNEESRKRYDVDGSEEPAQINRQAARHGAYGFNGFYDEVDAEEIFRDFFFGGMAPGATQFGPFRFRTAGMGGGRRAYDVHGSSNYDQRSNVHGSSNSNLRSILQLLPVILLLLLSFLPSSDPPYSLSRSYPYEHKLETARGVNFFVKPGNFEQQYPHNSVERMTLEQSIEKEYVSIVSQNCQVELQRQRWGYGNGMPHCDMLRKYEAAVA